MIAFDTNLLVRLAVEDDPVQWRMADQLLTECVEQDKRCLIGILVLCETVWVLRSVYRASREDLALTIETQLIKRVEPDYQRVVDRVRMGQILRRALETLQLTENARQRIDQVLIARKGGIRLQAPMPSV